MGLHMAWSVLKADSLKKSSKRMFKLLERQYSEQFGREGYARYSQLASPGYDKHLTPYQKRTLDIQFAHLQARRTRAR